MAEVVGVVIMVMEGESMVFIAHLCYATII